MRNGRRSKTELTASGLLLLWLGMMKFIIIVIVGVINEEMLDQDFFTKQRDNHRERIIFISNEERHGFMSFAREINSVIKC